MEIPGLGAVTKDRDFNGYQSKPIAVPVLSGKKCKFIVENYDADRNQQEFHAAIANFLSIDASVLKAAEPHLFEYYQDCCRRAPTNDDDAAAIKSPADVWRHIRFGRESVVSRRPYGDEGIYISLECGCDWEEEHGLQIVFKNGLHVNKVGPYDGHLTNSDAYGEESLEDVVYRAL